MEHENKMEKGKVYLVTLKSGVVFLGLVMTMLSLILPWFWVKLALLFASLVLAVVCLLTLIRRFLNSSTNVQAHTPATNEL